MDYIREELLRQRAVLARLLLGQSTETEKRQREETSEMTDAAEEYGMLLDGAEHFWASRRLAAGERFRPGRTAARTVENSGYMAEDGTWTAEDEVWAVHSGLREELPEAALQREMGRAWTGGRAVRSAADMEEQSAYRYSLRDESVGRRRRAAVAISGEIIPAEHMVTETIWTAAGETGSAKELSRVFQRDARRYDGGFTLY